MIFLALACLCFGGCDGLIMRGEPGSGVSKTESRDIDAFEEIELSGVGDLTYSVSSDETASLTLTTDDNLLPLVLTSVENGVLKIKLEKPISPKIGLKIEVSSPSLKRAELAGACKAKLNDLAGESFQLEIAGACNAELKGQVTKLEIDGAGAVNVNSMDCDAEDVNVDMSGAASARVRASKTLNIDAAGAVKVSYAGECEVTKSTAGVSKVSKINE
jgi:hypothetical protein